MENASHALLIVGAVLVALIILGVGISLIISLSENARRYDSTISDIKIQKFNKNFAIYAGEDNITAQEIATLISFANEQEYKVDIIVDGKFERIYPTSEEFIPEKFISKYQNNSFRCPNNSIKYDEITGRITRIVFTKY